MEKLTNIIESLLFVSGKEISIVDIAEKLEISKNEVKLAAMELQEKYSGDSGLHFIYFNDKIQFGSNPEYGEAVKALCPPEINVIKSDVPPIYGGAVEAMYDVGLGCDVNFKKIFMSEF